MHNRGAPRAVIYARYSSDNQRDASIEDQIEICRRYAERQGWSISKIYEDRAVSGSSIRGRGGYLQLQADAKQRLFDVLLVESVDRLSRRLADVSDLYDQLNFAGIKLYAHNAGELTGMHIAVMGMMAQQYVRDLGDKTKRGQLGRARAGKIPGGKAYGYDVLPAGADGAGNRRINRAEAPVVRRIFERFAAGDSPRRIARDLNEAGVPGPEGREWIDTTIRGQPERGTGILNNAIYVGRLEWNRCSYVKDPKTGRRIARPNPRSEWEVVDAPDLRIVDDELWERVKERQQTSAREMARDESGNALNVAHRRKFLLSGLLTCGVCGGGYTIMGKDRYGCSAHRSKGTCSNDRTISRQEIEDRVLSTVRSQLLTPELVEAFARSFHEEMRRLQREQVASRGSQERELADVQRRISAILKAVEDGLYDSAMRDRLEQLRKREAELRLRNESATTASVAPHPNLAKVYADEVAALEAGLDDPLIKTEAMETLRRLIERIDLVPREDDPGLSAEVRGNLAAILTICKLGKDIREHPAAVAAGCRVSVVAGAGFEPATFRL